MPRLQVLALYEGWADSDLGEDFHKSDNDQCDRNDAKVGFGNQPSQHHDEEQLEQARTAKQDLESSGMFRDPVVTEISMILEFYPAEDYHQNYYQENSGAGYCQFVIRPKMQKLGFE